MLGDATVGEVGGTGGEFGLLHLAGLTRGNEGPWAALPKGVVSVEEVGVEAGSLGCSSWLESPEVNKVYKPVY